MILNMSKIGNYIIQNNIDTSKHDVNYPTGWASFDDFVNDNLEDYADELETYYDDSDDQ